MTEENKEYLLKDKFVGNFRNNVYISRQIDNPESKHVYSYINYFPIEDKEKNQITHTFKIEQDSEKDFGTIVLVLDKERENITGFEYKKDDNVYKHEFKDIINIQNILDDSSCVDKLFKNHINDTLQKFLLTEEEKNKEDILNRDINSQNNNNDNSDIYIPPEPSSKKSSGVASTVFSTLLGGVAFTAITLATPFGIGVAIATALTTFGITKSVSKLFDTTQNPTSLPDFEKYCQQMQSDDKELQDAINCAFESHNNNNENSNNDKNGNENNNNENSNNNIPKNLSALGGIGEGDNASEPPKTGGNNKPKSKDPDKTPNR